MLWHSLPFMKHLSLIKRPLRNGGRCLIHLLIQLVQVKVGSNEALIYI
jgi:hypothetical protein